MKQDGDITPDREPTAGQDLPEAPAGMEAADTDLAALQQALQEAESRCLRAMADFDNFRRRTQAQQAEASQAEKKRFALDLLEVVDNFQRALDHGAPAGAEEFTAGIRAIHQLLLGVLSRHGVERMDVEGTPFDPNVHEVLDTLPDPDRPDQTVTRVYQDGYLFGGRLLRPALVQVSVRPESPAREEA